MPMKPKKVSTDIQNVASTLHLYVEGIGNPIKITLDKQDVEYEPGENLTGIISLNLDQPLEIKKMTMQILGTGRTSWAVAKKQLKSAYASTESYIDTTQTIVDTAQKLEPGLKEYPFSYTLPPAPLPSTFIDAFGSITYVIKVNATVTTAEPKSKDKEETTLNSMTAFHINGRYDLNEDPLLNQKAELYDRKTVGCLCCKSGRIEITVSLPHRGFLIGDQISWVAEIVNNSSSKINQISANLIQHTLYHAGANNKADSKSLTSSYAGAIGTKRTEIWEGNLDLSDVTPLPPSTLGGGKLIMVNYGLEFELEVNGCTKNLKSEIPIAIGTTGLKENDEGQGEAGVKSETGVSKFGKTK